MFGLELSSGLIIALIVLVVLLVVYVIGFFISFCKAMRICLDNVNKELASPKNNSMSDAGKFFTRIFVFILLAGVFSVLSLFWPILLALSPFVSILGYLFGVTKK